MKKVKITIWSQKCVCGKKYKDINKKQLAKRMNGHLAKCNIYKFIKRISEIPYFKNKPLKDVLIELGVAKKGDLK